MKAAVAMSAEAADAVLDQRALGELAAVCELVPGVIETFDDAALAALRDVDVLVTGWGCPPVDEAVLTAAPRLRAIVHTAGTVRGHVTPACWQRGIEVSSAAAANAVPVAEYALAMILLEGKRVLDQARDYRRTRVKDVPPGVGNFGRVVGVLSASLVGRRLIELLRPHDFEVLLCDPYVDRAEAEALGARPVELAELFASSDVVSVHTPLLPSTRGLVGRELIESMRPGAVLINTARGAVVDQDALADAPVRAVLDVTEPEVLPAEHPLWRREDVLITPHIAGSQGNELRRLARHAIDELRRWVDGAGFAHPVHHEHLERIA
ncbi:hydroxyacid dehydrogenase [Saccharopolyspora griseoalba]|uniref:Hydroxyacid dehydrogenase n=1 Tax=Saccharopolyspora griseoalba TaxID=1431848 RepID=A0ABW2LQP7_9PSEU